MRRISLLLFVVSLFTFAFAQNPASLSPGTPVKVKLQTTLATFSNLDRSTPGSYTLAGDYSLAGFAGRTVRIQFRTANDSAALTTFRIDDVSVR